MNKNIILVKYNKKTKDIKCSCGGDVWVDGKATHEIPVGLGDLGEMDSKLSGKFGVTKIRYKGWIGQCEKCKKRVLAWESKKIVNRIINDFLPRPVDSKGQSVATELYKI